MWNMEYLRVTRSSKVTMGIRERIKYLLLLKSVLNAILTMVMQLL